MSPERRRLVRRWLSIGGAGVALAVVAAAIVVLRDRPGDVYNPGVQFTMEPPPAPAPSSPARPDTEPFTWAVYGYSKERRHYLPASTLVRPPFARLWSVHIGVLLEFSPVLGGRSLYVLDNKGVLFAIARRRGRVRWTRRLGTLAASSPAYASGRVFVTLLRALRGRGGRVAALSARTGRILWSRSLPSRSESSPLIHHGRLYFGSEDGTVYALRTRDGALQWRFRARGAVKAGLALSRGRLYFGDYAGRLYALRRRDGRPIWQVGTHGAALGRSGQFYATPAVAYGRVYIGNTDGNVYSYDADRGLLAWRKATGDYVYAPAAVAQVPGGRPTIYVGSYDGTFYALDARSGRVRWRHRDGGHISGAATVVGDIVYFSNIRKRTTTGLGARTGRVVFRFGHGAFNPVVSDGRMIFLTGSTTLYGLRPRRRDGERAATRAERRGAERRRSRAR